MASGGQPWPATSGRLKPREKREKNRTEPGARVARIGQRAPAVASVGQRWPAWLSGSQRWSVTTSGSCATQPCDLRARGETPESRLRQDARVALARVLAPRSCSPTARLTDPHTGQPTASIAYTVVSDRTSQIHRGRRARKRRRDAVGDRPKPTCEQQGRPVASLCVAADVADACRRAGRQLQARKHGVNEPTSRCDGGLHEQTRWEKSVGEQSNRPAIGRRWIAALRPV